VVTLSAGDPRGQAWALMRRFVEAHNRRPELADAILLRPPEAFTDLSGDDLAQLTAILDRLLEADAGGTLRSSRTARRARAAGQPRSPC